MANDLPSTPITRTPVPDRALHHVVYATIVDAIHRGEMRPGDRITEADIAQRLGISHSPVREAFTRLAADHLIVRLPRRGNFVAQFENRDVDHIREARLLIEGYAARIAAKQITPADVALLEDIVEQMVTSALEGTWMTTVSLNARFHAAVISIGGNPFISRMWSAIDPLTWLVAATLLPGHRHNPEDLERRHRHLIETLVAGDADAAEQAFRVHIAESVMIRKPEVSSSETTAAVINVTGDMEE
ncbi:MAG TPA: GntR family transcriptional regulator [Nitrolancea sp.]